MAAVSEKRRPGSITISMVRNTYYWSDPSNVSSPGGCHGHLRPTPTFSSGCFSWRAYYGIGTEVYFWLRVFYCCLHLHTTRTYLSPTDWGFWAPGISVPTRIAGHGILIQALRPRRLKGNRWDCSNYCGITLLNLLGKVFAQSSEMDSWPPSKVPETGAV